MQGNQKVLLVEDDDIDILAFERAIKKGNLPFEITVARNGQEALEIVAKEHFACVFLDYLLPGEDGLSLLKNIRNHGLDMPVVIVTSQGNEKIAVEMMKSGALDYITKEEINTDRISILVNTAARLQQSEDEKRQAETSLRENRKLLENIFNGTTVGMLLLNEAGNVLRANKSFIELSGKAEETLIKQHFDNIFENVLKLNDVINGTTEFSLQNGSRKYFSVSSNHFTDEENRQFHIINFADITNKVIYENQVIWQNSKLEAVFESTNGLIFSLDKDYRITSLNSATKKAFRMLYNVDVVEGQNFFDIPFDEENRNSLTATFERAFLNKRASTINKFGIFYFETTCNPIKDINKKPQGITVFSTDITQDKINEMKLIESKKEAEDAVRAKSQFLSNMSHEIRTPMNAIIGLTKLLLEDGNVSEKQFENLNTIKFSADNLLVIINDILDFSKIESGKIDFEEIPFSCKQIIAQTLKAFTLQAKIKHLELKSEVDDQIPDMLMGDPYRLTQIINNLVSNAIKFTEKGYVKISASILDKMPDQHIKLRFSVEDSGLGIHKDKLGSIFESFTQAYTDTTRRFGGTGLGLAITKRLLEMQGGSISVSSQPGQGSIFSFEILYRTNTDATNMASIIAEQVKDEDIAGLKVLVVEDNKANQLVARQILSRWKTQTTILGNGREAVEYLETETPDLILMDLQMPEISGFEAMEIIRDRNSSVLDHDVPVVALTADVFPETRERIFSSGMNDFLLKPYDIEELKEKLIRFGVKKTVRG